MIPDLFIRHQPGSDRLVEGCCQIRRWRSSRVPIPVRIWFGPPLDPDEEASAAVELDRSPRWQVMVGGILLGHEAVIIGGLEINGLADFWPACSGDPITRAEHDYLVARAAWASTNDLNDPLGACSGRIDPMTATLPFMESA